MDEISSTAQLSDPPPVHDDDIDLLSSHPKDFGVAPGLVWAFRIHDDGSAVSLPVNEPIETRHDGWLWLHFNLADARGAKWLRAAKLPAPAAAMLLSRETHQQLHASEACIYGVFADLVKTIGGTADQVGHLHFIMTERMLISGRHHALSCVESARQTIERGTRRLPHVAALLELIVEHVGDGMDGLIDELAGEIDKIEDNIAASVHHLDRQKLANVRRVSVKVHRQLAGLRTLFHRMERDGLETLPPPLQIAAGKLAQRLDALDHDIVEMRDRARLLQEEITALTAEETNRHLYILSILTTLFLPPTLVTGIFGMNTKGLPFTENEDAFLLAAGLMVASAIAVYLLMRRVGVFKL